MNNPADESTEPFEFAVWKEDDEIEAARAGIPDVELSNTERYMLRQLAGPGELLHRVQAGMVDYARKLRHDLMVTDLDSEGGVERARRLQRELKAVDWQRRMWERLLTPLPEPEAEENGEGTQ